MRLYKKLLMSALSKIFSFDLSAITFTPNMAVRTGPAGVFDGAPIVQGEFDGTGGGDSLIIPRGGAIGNETESTRFYANVDSNKGTLSFWITPEVDGDAGYTRNIWRADGNLYLNISASNNLTLRAAGGTVAVDVSSWVAGTSYYVVARWDSHNTLDGTNYGCISINDSHTYGITSGGNAVPSATITVGGYSNANHLQAVIEGLTIYRRILYDGAYGTAINWNESGPIDELAAIYNAGSGVDPTTITGSWDAVLCIPTDTNTSTPLEDNPSNHAWSHPHNSSVPEHSFADDGGYLGGDYGIYANNTFRADAGSATALDDLPNGVNGFTVDFWVRKDDNSTDFIMRKSNSSSLGWRVDISSVVRPTVYCATTNATSVGSTTINDGKFHHIAVAFEHVDQGGDGKIYIAIDGKWETLYGSQVAGSGAYQSDAAETMEWGRSSSSLIGVQGWTRLSDTVGRYVVGTNFVAPRVIPAADANTVEQWAFDEGAGSTVAATVSSPTNDASLTNHTWEAQWNQEGTPVVPVSLELSGSDSWIDVGSGANIDDLFNGSGATIDFWAKLGDTGETGAPYLISKGTWYLYRSGSNLAARVQTDAGNTTISYPGGLYNFHHYAITYDDTGDRKIRIFKDGVLSATSVAATGSFLSDVANDLILGATNTKTQSSDITFGWVRVSNNIRYTSNFVPPSRMNPPVSDANTQLLLNMDEGAGTTAADSSSNGYNGTIVGGTWRNTVDMAVDEGGARVFPWGYNIASDGANDGLAQIVTGLSAGTNYVLRVPVSVGQSGRAQPSIQIYDETNSAIIGTLAGPKFTGTHDTGANSATLVDSTARWPQMLDGWTVYNITDGSSGTITDVSADMTTITATLSGGTDNDWDVGDTYLIRPPSYRSYSQYPWAETFVIELPTIARDGAAADCTSISWKVINAAGDGVMQIHQYEVQESLIDNGGFEHGSGDPWLPDGYDNLNLDAGDTANETSIVHSGSASVNFLAADASIEALYQRPFNTGVFYGVGGWRYNGAAGRKLIFTSNGVEIQASSSVRALSGSDGSASWTQLVGVYRQEGASSFLYMMPFVNGSNGYFDDVYAFTLDPVTLTITPASEANSLESGGIRVDGLDACTQPIPAGLLTATSGTIKFKYQPRHNNSKTRSFGNANSHIAEIRYDNNNKIAVYFSATNVIAIWVAIGGSTTSGTWAASGAHVPNTDYLYEVSYDSSAVYLKVDGSLKMTVPFGGGIDWGFNIPNSVVWGANGGNLQQIDAVFKAP